MAAQNSGRPPAETFVTVQDPEQARLLSDPQSMAFFRPFVARERTATQAAQEVGCSLDTMLYRVKTFVRAGLLQVARLEKRAGRPIKHYRSGAEAYFVPFEVTPYAELEERLREHHRARQERVVRGMARLIRARGREGRQIYRRQDDGEVWEESAGRGEGWVDRYDARSLARYLEQTTGPVGDDMMDEMSLRACIKTR